MKLTKVSLDDVNIIMDTEWRDNGYLAEGRKHDKSKVFMVPVTNRKKETLLPLIQKWIKTGTIIHSDCWKAYNYIPKLGYTHVTVNHSKEFINEHNAACTNSIESDWRHAKVMLPRYGVQRGLHSAYLAEFMWR